jgi:hypothetical protein
VENSFIVSYLASGKNIHIHYSIKMQKMQEDFCAAPTCQNGNRGAARGGVRGRGSEKFSTAAQKIKITNKLSFTQFPQSSPPFFAKKGLKTP